MVAFLSLQDVIPKIIKNINFAQYLSDNGYQLLKDKKVKGFLCFSKKNELLGEDLVFLGNHKSGEEMYYSMLFNDQGNIIDFVKNRIEFDNDYETFAPTKDHMIETIRKLVAYINANGENERITDSGTTDQDIENLKQNTFTTYYNAEPIFDTKYLETYNIKKSIINHEIFKNTIYNTRGLIINEEQLDVINTVFPLLNESGKECGLYFENHVEKKKGSSVEGSIDFFAPGTIETGIWFSNNLPTYKTSNSKVTIVNNPKDALAHFSYLRENRYYLAVFKKDETTYSHIKSVLNRQRSHLYLAGNVSIQNFVEEIKIIINILPNNIEFVKEHYDHILVNFDKEEQPYFEKILKLMQKNNVSKVEQVISTLGKDCKPHLKNDLFMPSNIEGSLLVKVPKNLKTMYYFQQILIKTFPSQYNIVIEKPMYLDWTKQNIKFSKAIEDKTSNDEVISKYIEEEKIFILSN